MHRPLGAKKPVSYGIGRGDGGAHEEGFGLWKQPRERELKGGGRR